MAINPMQRRTRNSLIIGLLIGLLITAIVAGLLIYQISLVKNDLKKEKEKAKRVVVAAKDIVANTIISEADVVTETIITNVSVANIVGTDHISGTKALTENTTSVSNIKVSDVKSISGKTIKLATSTPSDNTETPTTSLVPSTGSVETPNTQTPGTPSTTNTPGSTIQTPQLEEQKGKLLAKVDIPKGSIITKDMVKLTEDKAVDHDKLREVEYSNVLLPSELKDQETVDIRIAFPDGTDYIVLAKKIVYKADANTIWLHVDEHEILRMNSAIVESYFIKGSKLYAVNLTDPGIQSKANQTYLVRDVVASLIKANPNIPDQIRTQIAGGTNRQGDMDQLESKVEAEIKKKIEKRNNYIEKISGNN